MPQRRTHNSTALEMLEVDRLTWKQIEPTLDSPEAWQKISPQEEEAFLYLEMFLNLKKEGGPAHGKN